MLSSWVVDQDLLSHHEAKSMSVLLNSLSAVEPETCADFGIMTVEKFVTLNVIYLLTIFA